MQKYTDNANGDAPLTVENVFEFKVRRVISFGKEGRTFSFGKKNKIDQLFSL